MTMSVCMYLLLHRWSEVLQIPTKLIPRDGIIVRMECPCIRETPRISILDRRVVPPESTCQSPVLDRCRSLSVLRHVVRVRVRETECGVGCRCLTASSTKIEIKVEAQVTGAAKDDGALVSRVDTGVQRNIVR